MPDVPAEEPTENTEGLSKDFINELELLDATEVIQVVRRPDETLEVDIGEVDVDTAIALLAKGFIKLVFDELLEIVEGDDEEVDIEDDDE